MSEEKISPKRIDDSSEVVSKTMENFLSKADVDVVYGDPVQVGDSIVISAAEIVTASGFGYGSGDFESPEETQPGTGTGGGGGGGGYVFSRPVAMIVVNHTGVQVHPIIDTTKLAIAALTTLGFMAATIGKFYRLRDKYTR